MPDIVLTIGHSNHSSTKLIELLKAHQVTAVADVRSQPYSRMNPQFNREPLRSALKDAGITYVFLGRELGARTEDPSCYVEGKVQYDRLAKTVLFQKGLTRVEHGASRFRVTLLCAEKDPLACHRTILVSRHLVARGVRVAHILEDGRLEHHHEALQRLLTEVGMTERDFFRSGDELIMEAYALRGQDIAYVEKLSAQDATAERLAP